ncbi:MAG: hypothetical protein AAGC73_04445 [Verrucomicrobiota bacterium]
MKTLRAPSILVLAMFMTLSPLAGQTESEEEEKVFPTEVSDPPYEVGDLIVETGHYIDRGEELPSINFRIVQGKVEVFWIDSDGLVVEPESKKGSVRFTGSVRGRSFFTLRMNPNGSGLVGGPGNVLTPHIFNVILAMEEAESEKTVSFSFRYTPSLDEITVPEIPVVEDAEE